MLGILYRSVYRIPSILYAIHYGTEYQAYCMKYTTVQNTKHTVCNTLRYRIPSILYAIHYGRSVLHTVCLVFCTVVYCLICLVFCNVVFSYSMLGILYRSVLHTVCLVFCNVVYFIQYENTKDIKQYTTVQNTKHTVCNTLRYRMPSILYAIHYGTECQAYCMQYTTVQNAKHTGILLRSVSHSVCLAFWTVVYCIQYAWYSVP
jgi:hypothetical protein